MPFYQTAILDHLAPTVTREPAATLDITASTSPSIGVIVNPHARSNLNQPGRIGMLRALMGQHALVRVTHTLEELPGALAELLARGVKLLVADGGDGSLHQLLRVATALQADPARRALGRKFPAILPAGAGSINVVAHAAGLPTGELQLYQRLMSALEAPRPLPLRTLDTMQIELCRRTAAGREQLSTRGFVAAAGGVGQRFFDVLEEHGQRRPVEVASILGRSALSWLVNRSALGALASEELRGLEARIFRPTRARVRVDGRDVPGETFTGINVASIPVRFGPVMKVFARAAAPGRLNALYGDASAAALIANIPRGVLGLAPRDRRIADKLCGEMSVEAASSELLAPIIDGDRYEGIERITFRVAAPVQIPQL